MKPFTLGYVCWRDNDPGPTSALQDHAKVWRNLPEDIKKHLEIVLIDDCSTPPITHAELGCTDVKIYRIKDDIRWNITGAKNLLMHVAQNEWVLSSDIDFVATEDTIRAVFNTPEQKGVWFKVRWKFPLGVDPSLPWTIKTNKRSGSPPGVFLVHKKDYWAIGGMDEDFAGAWGYDDIYLEHRLNMRLAKRLLDNVVMLYREDAMTGGHPVSNNKSLMDRKIRNGCQTTEALRFEWEERANE